MGAMPSPNRGRPRVHTNPDHARRTHVPAPSDAEIEQRLHELVKPAVFAEVAYYRQLGLRNRLLTLPVMVALVLALIWRRVPGVCTLQRMLARERILWAEPTVVSQPALSERFLTFPAVLFERVLERVLARLPARQAARTRPLPADLAAIQARFAACYALDGTTLEALFRKLQSLRERPEAPLAGHRPYASYEIAHAWSAEFGETDDGLPLIGPVPGAARVLAAYGYGGNGITFSYMASRILAARIAGTGDHGSTILRWIARHPDLAMVRSRRAAPDHL